MENSDNWKPPIIPNILYDRDGNDIYDIHAPFEGPVDRLFDGPLLDKYCFVYCGPERCNCKRGNMREYRNLELDRMFDDSAAPLQEGLGSNTTAIFPEMSFSIERVAVQAKGRALKAEYSIELAQDLQAVHGKNAEAILSEILTGEILADINREVIMTINICAVPGSQQDTTTAGVFNLDVDANGRWAVEKFKGLVFHMEREANRIAEQTRRGKGNVMICSQDVASALRAADRLSYPTDLKSSGLTVDVTGNTFAGLMDGWLKVYVDPYAVGGNYFTMGFKGETPMDAGIFYCPYVPLQQVKAIDPNTFQPKIGYKTRYGMVANPFAEGTTQGLGVLRQDSNVYYRRTQVTNIM